MAQHLTISSEQNSQFKIYKSLLTAKGIRDQGQFFLMGEKLVTEFLRSPIERFKLQAQLCSTQHTTLPVQQVRTTFLTPELFSELDLMGTHFPMLLLSFQQMEDKDLQALPQGLELICPLGDPKNIGALARSALAFGAQEIILTQEAAHPYLPQAIKASAGALLKVRLSRAGALSQIPVIGENFALELQGQKLQNIKWPKDLRLWLGEEGPGLRLTASQNKDMQFINIPTEHVESLNATVSASLALWEWNKNQS